VVTIYTAGHSGIGANEMAEWVAKAHLDSEVGDDVLRVALPISAPLLSAVSSTKHKQDYPNN